MELGHVERQRYGLVQFLVVLMLIFLGAIVYLSWSRAESPVILGLAGLSLLTGLYVMARERGLAQEQRRLVGELVHSEIRATKQQHDLKEERERSSQLDFRLRELTSLYRAICSVNSLIHPEQAYVTVLRAAMELVEANRGSIMLLDNQGKRLRIVCAQGLDPEVISATSQPIGEGVAGWVACEAEPVLLSGDAEQDGRFKNLIERDPGPTYAMSVPLSLRGHVTGVINIGSNTKGPRRFTEYHLRLATIFCQHAAVAIENAQLRAAHPERELALV